MNSVTSWRNSHSRVSFPPTLHRHRLAAATVSGAVLVGVGRVRPHRFCGVDGAVWQATRRPDFGLSQYWQCYTRYSHINDIRNLSPENWDYIVLLLFWWQWISAEIHKCGNQKKRASYECKRKERLYHVKEQQQRLVNMLFYDLHITGETDL